MKPTMRHPLDLTSLIWGVLLALTAGLLAVSRWSAVELSGPRIVPVILLGLGVLILAATFLRGSQPQRDEQASAPPTVDSVENDPEAHDLVANAASTT
ncbi:MAG: hypothetical protein ACOYEV_07830 [Candidatus Nanopelagicales bacterium]